MTVPDDVVNGAMDFESAVAPEAMAGLLTQEDLAAWADR